MLSKKQIRYIFYGIILGFAFIGICTTALFIGKNTIKFVETISSPKKVWTPPDISKQIIEPNEYSRPGIELKEVKGIVIHYTANPGTSAQQNHDYFAGLANTHLTKASSHYIIGLDGEIIQCIPRNEQAYASNNRNSDTLSIECCHFDDTGEFYVQTYESLVHLVAWLEGKYDLSEDDVIRHYDVSQKICPKYYVDHPEEWDQFKLDVKDYIEEYGTRRADGDKKE